MKTTMTSSYDWGGEINHHKGQGVLQRPGRQVSEKYVRTIWRLSFPAGPDGKESAHHAGEPGSIPGSGRSPAEDNGYQLQYSCLENSMS